MVDKNIVALTFDERVKFNTAAMLVLSVDDNSTPKTYANKIELTAVDILEDDTVVEFCYYAAGGTTILDLPENVTYSVYKIVYYDASSNEWDGGITDYAGNPVVVGDVMNADISFEGSSETHEAVEMDSYSQIDATTFELVFPRKVVIVSGGTPIAKDTKLTVSTTNSMGSFDVYYESAGKTEDDKIRITKKVDYLVEDTDYVFNFRDFLQDKLGFAVANDEEDTSDPDPSKHVLKTELTGEYDDEDEPYVDDVVARDRKWIKVIFNERVDELSLIHISEPTRPY